MELPYIISFQRSGSHWLNCSLELATDKRRIFSPYGIPIKDPISFVPKEFPEAWVHSHGLPIRPESFVMYLYRDPVDVLYSSYMVRKFSYIPPKSETEFIINCGQVLRKHLLRWTVSEDKADEFVRYEDLKADNPSTLRRVARSLNIQITKPNFDEDEVTKGRLVGAKREGFGSHFHSGMLEPEYEEGRTLFRNQHAEMVYNGVLGTDLRFLFPEI